jgi:hypothetical protein
MTTLVLCTAGDPETHLGRRRSSNAASFMRRRADCYSLLGTPKSKASTRDIPTGACATRPSSGVRI